MSLPTAAQIRERSLQQFTGNIASIDTLLTSLIATADAVCATYCRFPAAVGAVPTLDYSRPGASLTLYVDGPKRSDPRDLWLRVRPVHEITAVHVDTTGDWTYATELTEDTDFVTEEGGHLILTPSATVGWGSGRRANRVQLTAGFDVANYPPLVQAIGLLVASWFFEGTKPPQIQSASAGGQNAAYVPPDGLPVKVRALLSPYVLTERETHGR